MTSAKEWLIQHGFIHNDVKGRMNLGKTLVSCFLVIMMLLHSVLALAEAGEQNKKFVLEFTPSTPEIVEKLNLPISLADISMSPDNYPVFLLHYGYLMAQLNLPSPTVVYSDWAYVNGYVDFVTIIADVASCRVNAKNEVQEYSFEIGNTKKKSETIQQAIYAIAALEYGGSTSEEYLKATHKTTPIAVATEIFMALYDLFEKYGMTEDEVSRGGVQTERFVYSLRNSPAQDRDGNGYTLIQIVATPVRK